MKHSGTRIKFDTKKLVTLALFCALAYAVMLLLHLRVSFLTFDAKDALITLAAMIFGPLAGLVCALAVTLLEMVTVSGTGFYGWIMNFASSALFACTASFIYRRIRVTWGALLGLFVAIITTTVGMLLLNLVITPLYTNVTVEDVIKMIPGLLLPFNLIKTTLNAALVLIFYKPVSAALRRARLIEAQVNYKYKFGAKSIATLTGGIVIAVVCVLVLIFVLGGDISFL